MLFNDLPSRIRLMYVHNFVTGFNIFLSHNNPCFQSNMAITNFLVSNTCELRFYDVIDSIVRMFTP